MKNLTVSITDETYRQARIWAAQHGTSVSAAVQYMLENIHSILRVRHPPVKARFAPCIPPERTRIFDGETVEVLPTSVKSVASAQELHRNTETGESVAPPVTNAE